MGRGTRKRDRDRDTERERERGGGGWGGGGGKKRGEKNTKEKRKEKNPLEHDKAGIPHLGASIALSAVIGLLAASLFPPLLSWEITLHQGP